MAGDAKHAAQHRALRFIINNIAASPFLPEEQRQAFLGGLSEKAS
jgi:hypothetical protein